MAWDLALDENGDLSFGPTHDLMGVSGVALDMQRITTRCKIPRGTYTYDETGTLGSRLYRLSSSLPARQLSEAPTLVEEALEPMDDIQVGNVIASFDENNRLHIEIQYTPITSSAEGEDVVVDPTSSYDARVTI